MDSPRSSSNKRTLNLLIVAGVIILIAVFVLPRFFRSKPKVARVNGDVTQITGWSLSSLLEIYGQAWVQIQTKVDEIRRVEEENLRLRSENSRLRVSVESLQFDRHTRAAASTTKQYEQRLTDETGDLAGRAMSSIRYKVPEHFLPAQLHTLGVTYLKAKEDEKAAVIFTVLTGLQDTDFFRTSKNYLITAVAWFRLENYTLANHYLDECLRKPETPESIQFQAQARLWKAVVASQLNAKIKVQYWLNELVDHHPHSTEALWINPKH